MTQILGLDFTVTVTSATTFTIPLDSSGFASPGTAGVVRKLQPPLYVPELRVITSITAASPGVVTAVPIGDANDSLASATQNVGIRGITLGPAIVGSASDLLFWIAYKVDNTQSS